MKPYFVDTNIFIRYLTNDDPVKADRVDKLLNDAAAGRVRLVTAEMVLAEVVWVLESFYGLKNVEVGSMVKAILATPGLEVLNSALVEKALEYYLAHNIDFVDGYIAAVMDKRKISDIYSYDKKHLTRIKSIKRKQP
ncbi:MAG: PIN domain-containing protein [Thermodesulfobacteriota bacterium]|nr:PIN domain-containing protein [Thermodesulfobacteriota bacterium]